MKRKKINIIKDDELLEKMQEKTGEKVNISVLLNKIKDMKEEQYLEKITDEKDIIDFLLSDDEEKQLIIKKFEDEKKENEKENNK